MSTEPRHIKSTPYTDFYRNVAFPKQLIKNFLVKGMRHNFIGTFGAAKTSVGLHIAGSILSQQEKWVNQFEINAPNPVIFFISEDAADSDLKMQSYKVLREYIQWDNPNHVHRLQARFHIVAGQNVKLPLDADAVSTMIRETIFAWYTAGQLQPFGTPEVSFGDGETMFETVPLTERLEQEEEPVIPPVPSPENLDLSQFDILVIYDSARQIHHAKESDSGEMSLVTGALSKIERETGATTILLMHENRQGTYKGDTSVMDNAQQGYQFSCPEAKRNDPIRRIEVKVKKNRGLDVKTFFLDFEWTGLGEVDEKGFTKERIRLGFGGFKGEEPETKKAGPSRVVTGTADPVMAAARSLWRPGMSQRGLKTGLRGLGVSFSNDRIPSIHTELKGEDLLKATPRSA